MVKRAVNIQVNGGTIHGGIHVYGSGAGRHSRPQLPASSRAVNLWPLLKVLGLVVVGAFALLGAAGLAAALLVVVLGVLGLALGWAVVSGIARVVVFVDDRIISAGDIAMFVPRLGRTLRQLASGQQHLDVIDTTGTNLEGLARRDHD